MNHKQLKKFHNKFIQTEKNVNVSLAPEEVMRKTLILNLTETNFESCISREIPYNLNELAYDYCVIEKDGQWHLEFYAIPLKKASEILLAAEKNGQKIIDIKVREFDSISLLPKESKKEKDQQQFKRSMIRILLIGLCGLFLINAAFFLEMRGLNRKIEIVEKRTADLKEEVKAAKQSHKNMEELNAIRTIKAKILNLILLLGTGQPADFTIKKIAADKNEVTIQGETSRHSSISKIMDTLSRDEMIKKTSLEQSKMRKRLNREYLEFKITAEFTDE